MTLSMRRLATVALALVVSAQAVSADTRRIIERDEFVNVIEGQTLTRFGIRLEVNADGAIRGKAFGKPVTGKWRWQEGYFCRDLYWGERDLGPNCQAVTVQGDVVRFTSDRGQGEYADLTLR